MIKSIFALAALALAVPAFAQGDRPEVTVIADNTAVCGPARLSYHKQADNERAARKVAFRLEREGKRVNFIVLNPGQQIGTFNRRGASPAPIVLSNPC